MSMDRCSKCDRPVDTDEYPDCYYDENGDPRDACVCESCQQSGGPKSVDLPREAFP